METTPFEQAFRDLLNSTRSQPKKHLSKFLLKCQNASKQVSLQTAGELIDLAEKASSERTSRRVTRKILEPVVESLKAYDKVISTLCSADPMPTAIIWGSLKVVIDCTERFANLFSLIRTQLSALRDQIEDVQAYEALFGRSPELQRSLFEFYRDVLRFWSRVDKECHRPAILSMVQSAVPLSMTKIRNIINDIENDVDKIHVKVQHIDLRESKDERELNLQARQAQQDAEMNNLLSRLRDWLDPSAFQSSIDAHHRHVTEMSPGTLEWLHDDENVQVWMSAQSKIPLLWATAAPGFGKTIACSKVIEIVKKEKPEAAVCYHFYKGSEHHPGSEVMRSFALQLLESVWSHIPKIIADVQKIIQKHKGLLENIISLIELMLGKLPYVFFFIDGLDEAIIFGENRVVIDTLTAMCMKFRGRVCFWCSSQSTAAITEMMKDAKAINFDGRNGNDVHRYLHRALSQKYQSEEIDEEDQLEDIDQVAARLCDKAHGNFMWAFLMKHDIEHADSPAELFTILNSNIPDGLDQYYRRILHRIDKSKWSLASLLLSLVCFSRRPLRISELREAVAILRTTQGSSIDRMQRPFPRDIQKILLPLVQLEESDHYGNVCKVSHSTLKVFLHRNPNVFCHENTAACKDTVSAMLLGEACLRYLQQARFSRLLIRKDMAWHVQDGSELGSTIEKHPFMAYAAKYWSTHLDMTHHENDSEIYRRTAEFVASPNFWTCLQIQSLFVLGQFCTYTVRGIRASYKFKRRSFPHWFISQPTNNVFSEYRTFLHEWGYFLDNCNSEKVAHGEIDRCLTSVLGPRSFLAGVEQRHKTFIVDYRNDIHADEGHYENISPDGRWMSIVRMRTDHNNDNFELCLSHFDVHKSSSSAWESDIKLCLSVNAVNWLPYTCLRHVNDRSCVCVGKPSLVTTSSCGNIVRVADKLWRYTQDRKFKELKFTSVSHAQTAIDHVESKDNFVFVTSRLQVKVKREVVRALHRAANASSRQGQTAYRALLSDYYEAFSAPEQLKSNNGRVETESTDREHVLQLLREKHSEKADQNVLATHLADSDSDALSDSGDESATVHEFETEQYWSDASTVPETYNILADEVPMHVTVSSADEETSSSSASASNSEHSDEDTSDSEMSVTVNIGVSATDEGSHAQYEYFEDMQEDYVREQAESDDSEDFGGRDSGDEEHGGRVERYMNFFEQYTQRQSGRSYDPEEEEKKRKAIIVTQPIASLKIYREDGNMLKPIFKYSWSNARPVLNSPPAIHPTKSLVIWPLTNSLLLFADYAQNTWFKKKLRPPRNCHFLTIRCHFSACGSYLHIAALKRRSQTPLSDKKKRKKKNDKEKKGKATTQTDSPSHQSTFSLVILTYILSARKTTHSPPRLIYQRALSLPTMKVPLLTFIWTKEELFATHSDVILRTFRINLFPSTTQAGREQPSIQSALTNVAIDAAAMSNALNAAQSEPNSVDIMVPKEAVYLPFSARNRLIYFIPSTQPTTAKDPSIECLQDMALSAGQVPNCSHSESPGCATVLIGPERPPIALHRTPALMQQFRQFDVGKEDDDNSNDRSSGEDILEEQGRREQQIIGAGGYAHIIGMLLDCNKELGGWQVSDFAEKIPEGQGFGTFDDMMELFDPKDDCEDIEPWIMPTF